MHLVMFDVDGTLVNSESFEDNLYLECVRNVTSKPIDTDWSKYRNSTDTGILDEIIKTHGLGEDPDEVHRTVKELFVTHTISRLKDNPVNEIPGACDFVNGLRYRANVVIAIATGGWEETAKLKLDSAGIDFTGISFASGSESKSRTGVMKLAEQKCNSDNITSKTYFGDAIWDKRASAELEYNFILVGNRIKHDNQIADFKNIDQALGLIGL